MEDLKALAKKLRMLSPAGKLRFASELTQHGSVPLAIRVAEMAINELTLASLQRIASKLEGK